MQQIDQTNSRADSRFERRMNRGNENIITGVFLVLIGGAILLNKMYPEFPNWIISWKTLLIVIGLYVGFKHNFRGGGWAVPIIVGSVFLIIENFPDIPLKRYIWPIAIMLVGLFIILKPKFCKPRTGLKNPDLNNGFTDPSAETPVLYDKNASFTNDDIIESTNIFSGSKKINLSKTFRGGEITCVFGGSELNLSQADIQGRVELEVTCIFGGTKLIVPPDWNIQQEAVAIFGGIDDKRPFHNVQQASGKVLVLKGTVLMGGIDIRSF
ncbi:MAG: hypothetical protein EOO06_12360 [Chitinophagaceae bacterium]|nr:MAG: hypothetical protein EOO06_12360 [Chitinophagaceae bacterium]